MTTLIERTLERLATQSRPTVCQVLHTMSVGGAEVLAARLARRLRDDFRFVFACLDDLGTLGEQLRNEGFTVHVLGRKPGLDFGTMLALSRLFRREQVDVIQAHQYTPFFYAAAARWLGPRISVLFTEHGRHFPDYPRRKRMIVNRLILSRRDRVIGVGQAVRQALIANEGLSQERVGLVYNGIDLNRYAGADEDRSAVRAELGLGENDFAVFQVARLDYLKDHATAVRTIARAAQKRPNVRLVLVGEGPEGPKIRDQVCQLGVEKHILLLGLRTDVPRLLAAADLFLLTSISEGIPLTVIEAMAAGLPVVGTAVGGMGEVVIDGETGRLCPSGDDKALAEMVLLLADDVTMRHRMANHGRLRAFELFSEERMLDAYQGLYREMTHV